MIYGVCACVFLGSNFKFIIITIANGILMMAHDNQRSKNKYNDDKMYGTCFSLRIYILHLFTYLILCAFLLPCGVVCCVVRRHCGPMIDSCNRRIQANGKRGYNNGQLCGINGIY